VKVFFRGRLTSFSLRVMAFAALIVSLATLPVSSAAYASSLTILHTFCSQTNCTDGDMPYSGMISDSGGNYYGTTNGGGPQNAGVIYQLSPDVSRTKWTYKVIYNFCSTNSLTQTCTDGENPDSGNLAIDASGTFYGTTARGGNTNNGVVYSLSYDAKSGQWKQNVIYSFCSKANCADGWRPSGHVTLDNSGNIYGTTGSGGVFTNSGSVYKLTHNASKTKWTESIIYKFCLKVGCKDGSIPVGGLLLKSSGNLFGVTISGGAGKYGNGGTIFELSPAAPGARWTESVLYRFCSQPECTDGTNPGGGLDGGVTLISDAKGNLFGTALQGGVQTNPSCQSLNGCGLVFELARPASGAKWSYSSLHRFCTDAKCVDGASPMTGLTEDSNGNLYGTTWSGGIYGYGSIYKLTPNVAHTVWSEQVLYSFCALNVNSYSCLDGVAPAGTVSIDKTGALFGAATRYGDKYEYSAGTLYRLTP